jgi:hypothetical protein
MAYFINDISLTFASICRQRRALGDVSESQINSRQSTNARSMSSQKISKLNISVTKPGAKLAAPNKIFVEESSKTDFTVSVGSCVLYTILSLTYFPDM